MPTKKPKPKIAQHIYALYSEQAQKFWVGNTRKIEYIHLRYNWGSRPKTPQVKVHDWKPQFEDTPTDGHFWTLQVASDKWRTYEIERLGGAKVPTLKLMRQEHIYTPSKATVKVKPADVILSRMLVAQVPRDIRRTFEKVLEIHSNIEDACRYRYGFTRRGSKALIDEQFPNAISFGCATLLDSETDLVVAKVALADQFKTHIDLGEMLDLSFVTIDPI